MYQVLTPSPTSHALGQHTTDVYAMYYFKLNYVIFLASNIHLSNVQLVQICNIYHLPNMSDVTAVTVLTS